MKKKKLTINSLALGNLKQRKKQYTIMIIGIILAMVFSSSTLFFMFSSSETFREQEYKKYGYQYAVMYTYENDEKFYRDAHADGEISEYGFAHIIGYGYTNGNEADLGTSIAWLDDVAKALSNHSFIEGDYPTLENEIAIERTALLKLGFGLDAKVGDEITLKVKIQNGAEYYGETEKTYILSGILADKRSNIIYSWNSGGYGEYSNLLPAAIVADGSQTEVGGKELLSGYVDLYNMSYNARSDFWNYVSDNTNGYNYYSQGYGITLSAFNGILSNGSQIVFVAVALILASCVAIVNSFNTNLKERKKQIGMLRAVGATKRQIIRIFGREALIISLISTPVSVAVSYGLVKLLLTAISDEAVMTKSIWVLPVCAVVCVAVTMLAAMIPLIFASTITPMQAIRNIDISRKMKVKKIKTQKQFSVPSHLARRSAAFYKGGKIAVSIMLSVMILFSSLGFMVYHTNKAEMASNFTFDYALSNLGDWFTFSGGMSEADKRDIEAYPYFSSIKSKKAVSTILEVEDFNDYFNVLSPHYDWNGNALTYENFRENVLDNDNKEYLKYKNLFGNGNDLAFIDIYSYEKHAIESIEDLPMEGKINYDKLASGEEIILIAPETAKLSVQINDNGNSYRTDWDSRYNDNVKKGYQIVCEGECPYSVGDKIKLNTTQAASGADFYGDLDPEDYPANEREVTIGAIIRPEDLDKSNIRLYISGALAVLTTHAGMNFFDENARYLDIEMTVDDSIELDENIDETITAFLQPYADKYSGWFASNYLINQENKADMYSQLTSIIVIVTIGFVICASIVNNSLTATIRERKREIGTLRAVGADISVLVQSYIRQLISMFAYGYGIGIGLSVLIAIGLSIFSKYEEQTYGASYGFIFSPWETVAFCVILFAICSINLWSKVRKEMKNSIVENIKEL